MRKSRHRSLLAMSSKSTTKRDLIARALSARDNAYAPYSNFRVGAALLCDDGSVFLGGNVENASYGLCCCAERCAVGTAVAAGNRKFQTLVVATASSPPSTPCGMCRQVLIEFCSDLEIILVNPDGEQVETDIRTLFPSNFDADLLADGRDKSDEGDE